MFYGFFKFSITSFLLLIFSSIIAYASVENYQRQVVKNLSAASTDTLVWVRAFNNAYNKSCKNHETSKVYNLFFKVAAQTIVDQLMDRGDWTDPVWSAKYGYRKSQLNSLKNRFGNSGYCRCIYEHIIKGNSGCLQK
tara:strand:- start:626 stop:1036 length:411 start_codon:yes stop_codon:yes gene_type:complete